MSNLTAFPMIQERSEATPGLWNQPFSILSANIAAVDSNVSFNSAATYSFSSSISIGRDLFVQGAITVGTPPSVATRTAVNIGVRSDTSDYLYFTDSAAAKSNYIIGSHVGGTADGLNIWDASGSTMIASFSKQSIRFYQQVVGPVFDLGGALTDTYNAATFGTGSDSSESRIQAAINQASIDAVSRVYVPSSLYPYSASSVSFIYTVQMVREGGNYDVCDIQAYGASPTLAQSSNSAIQAAIRSGQSQGRVVYCPAGGYSVATLSFYSGSVIRGVVGSGSGNPPVYFYQGSASGPILQPADPNNPCSYFEIEELTLSASGNNNNLGGLDCGVGVGFLLRHVAISRMSSFCVRVTGGATAGDAGFGTIQDCIFSHINPAPCIMLVGTANDQPDGMLVVNNYFTVSNSTIIASLSSFNRGVDTLIMSGNRVESSTTDVSIMTGRFSKARVIGNRFETTHSAGTLRVALNPRTVGGSEPCAVFMGNAWAAQGRVAWNDNGATRSPRWLEDETGSISRGEVWDGTTINPAIAFASEASLGLYRSGTSALGLSYGQFQVPAGVAIQPAITFSSESSLGFFRSGASSVALSYGSLRLPLGGELLINGTGTIPFRMFESGNVYYITANRTGAFAQDNTGKASWMIQINTNAGVNDKITFAHNNPAAGGVDVASINSIGGWLGPGGFPISPWVAFTSEASLGFYRSGVSTLGLSYGALAHPSASNTTPSITWSSETSLGFYRSGAATIAQSLGTMNLATNAVRLSMRTLAASAVTASAAKTNVATDEVVFTVNAGSGASLCIMSGGTLYFFNSIGSVPSA